MSICYTSGEIKQESTLGTCIVSDDLNLMKSVQFSRNTQLLLTVCEDVEMLAFKPSLMDVYQEI